MAKPFLACSGSVTNFAAENDPNSIFSRSAPLTALPGSRKMAENREAWIAAAKSRAPGGVSGTFERYGKVVQQCQGIRFYRPGRRSGCIRALQRDNVGRIQEPAGG